MVKVRGSVAEVDGKFIEGPPKSEAGRRDVAIPEVIVPELRAHLDEHAQASADGRVFVGPTGAIPRRTNFQATWRKAVEAAGVPGLHFHDLRHSHKTWLIEDGVPEVAQAKRLGHRLPGVRGIYSHVSATVEQRLVNGLQARWEQTAPPQSPSQGDNLCN